MDQVLGFELAEQYNSVGSLDWCKLFKNKIFDFARDENGKPFEIKTNFDCKWYDDELKYNVYYKCAFG